MATYAVQGHIQPQPYGVIMGATGAVAYTLTSAADGTVLTGSGDALVVTSDTAGWLYVSDSANTDKAGVGKTHRVSASGIPTTVGAVRKGWWVSFLADA